MRVLVACEFSGIVRDAFIEAGHDAVSCDLLPSERPGPHLMIDALTAWWTFDWDLMVAFPPCTHLASSGARWFPEKRVDGRQTAALEFVLALADAPIPRIAIENPVGVLSSMWRKPDQIIQPYEHGHAERKATCLWLKNLPKLVPSDLVTPEWALNADGTEQVSAKGKRDSPTHLYTSGRKNLSPAQIAQWNRVHHEPPGPDRWKERSRTLTGIAKAMAEQWGNL